MPLLDSNGNPAYIRPVKIHVDSADAIATQGAARNGAFDYKVQLTEIYDKVVGIKLTAWDIPNSMAPSFIGATTQKPGNNIVDFTLTDPLNRLGQGAGFSTVFSFTWPEQSYTYENVVEPWTSYVDALPQLMNAAIVGDANWGGEVRFIGATDANEKTVIQAEAQTAGSFTATDEANLTFLFGSGLNITNSAYDQMGFAQNIDIASISVDGVQQIASPNPTSLNPFRYVDISLKQFPELNPIERVYFTNVLYGGTTRNDFSNTVTFLTDERPRRVEQFDVSLRLRNGVVPLSLNKDHALTFTLYLLSPENEVPSWAKQVFTL